MKRMLVVVALAALATTMPLAAELEFCPEEQIVGDSPTQVAARSGIDDGPDGFPLIWVGNCTKAEQDACEANCQSTETLSVVHRSCSKQVMLLPGGSRWFPNLGPVVTYCGCMLQPTRPGLVTNEPTL